MVPITNLPLKYENMECSVQKFCQKFILSVEITERHLDGSESGNYFGIYDSGSMIVGATSS